MNIYDVATKSGVSVRSLRKLEKLKLMSFDPEPDTDENPHAAQIRFLLMRNQQLPMALLLVLLDEPNALYDLRKYEARARDQLAALGDAKANAAPIEVYAVIGDAAGGDIAAAQTIADWLAPTLPREPVSHHWVAARLLLPMGEFQRADALGKVTFALMHMRRLESFAGYWQSVETAAGRKIINYFQKRNFPLDL